MLLAQAGRRQVVSLFVAAAATLLAYSGQVARAAGLNRLDEASRLELSVFQSRLGAGPLRPDPEILLVTIQEESPRRLGLRRPVLPLPRQLHGEMIRLLRDGGARALILDLLFTAPGAPEEDQALRTALGEAAPLEVTLAADYDRANALPDPAAPGGFRYRFRRPVVLPQPCPRSVRSGSAVAFDPGGTLRGAILLQYDEAIRGPIPHIALQALMSRYRIDEQAVLTQGGGWLKAGPLSWPVGEDGELFLRWTPRLRVFPRIEYAEAMEALRQRDLRFRGKIVILGDVSGGDAHHTPLGRIDGVEFVAHVLNTLLAPGVQRWTLPANAIWSLALALGVSLGISSLRRPVILASICGAVIAAVGLPQLLLTRASIWVDTAGPCLAIGGSALLSGLYWAWWVVRFKPEYLREKAASEEATVLFLDLQASTAMAERLGAAAARDLQARFLQRVSAIIGAHGGTVERTMGDGLMAVFHARGKVPHAVRAVKSALPLLQEGTRLAAEWEAAYGLRTGIRIGIESGMVAGTLLHAGHDEWSSFGPAVNMAARLQSACAELGVDALIGPCARALAQHAVATVPLGEIALKGFAERTHVYGLSEEPARREPAEGNMR